MTRISFIPDTGSTVKLVETSRDWMQHDIRLNHKRVIQPLNPINAPYGSGIDRGLRRNILTFKVSRGVNDAGVQFADAEEALLHLIDHPQALPSHGVVQMDIQGSKTNATRYLLDAFPEVIEVRDENGVTLGWQYQFTGGAFVSKYP